MNQGALPEVRKSRGTPAQLLHDATLLQMGHIRQIDDADAHLGAMWYGQVGTYAGVDATDNHWRTSAEGATLWSSACQPNYVDDQGDWWPGSTPGYSSAWTGLAGTCDASDATQAPDPFTDALRDVTGTAVDLQPVATLLGDLPNSGDATSPKVPFDWNLYVAGAGGVGFSVQGTFQLPNVDELYGEEPYGEEPSRLAINMDVVLERFLYGLATAATSWSSTSALGAIELGNELLKKMPDDDQAQLAARVAWLVLRASEIFDDAAPDLPRVFPGLKSPGGEGSCDVPASDDGSLAAITIDLASSPMDVERTLEPLRRCFFEIVRGALAAQQHSGNSERFRDVLGDGIVDANGILAVQAFGFFVTFDFLDLSYEDHAEIVRSWMIESGIRFPAHILDFHWYNNGGSSIGGTFSYLSDVATLYEALRAELQAWWSNGAEVEIWCLETGVSAYRNRSHYQSQRAYNPSDPDLPWCYGHLGVSTAAAGEAPLPAGGGSDYENLVRSFEFRVRPCDVLAAFRTGTAPSFLDDVWNVWPDWVFTSPGEQAIQVWTRFSYLAGIGVAKSFWFAHQVLDIAGGTDPIQEYYGYGLTRDTARSVFEEADEACGLALTDARFTRRPKNAAFCAMRRWNAYLDRYHAARVIPTWDGRTSGNLGFYAVAFRRDPGSKDAATYPFAVVAWADPQAYLSLNPKTQDHRYIVLGPDPFDVPPLLVATIPVAKDRAGSSPGSHGSAVAAAILNPCLAAEDSPDPGGYYQATRLWQFDPDRVADEGSSFYYVDVETDQAPVLILLPGGNLVLDNGGGAATFDLDAL